MVTSSDHLIELNRHCAALPLGPIADVPTLERLLAAAWNALTGSEGGMEGYKLLDRMEAVVWNPPLLSFLVERHGGTVQGSTRAELQHWHVDVGRKTASLGKIGWRQLRPAAKRFPMKKFVKKRSKNATKG